MKIPTKLFLLFSILFRIIGYIMGLNQYGQMLINISYVFLIILFIQLLVELRTSYLVYSIFIAIGIIGSFGCFLSVLHWKGSELLKIIGLTGGIFIGFLFIWNSMKDLQNKILIFHLLLGICIILQFVILIINLSYESIWYAKLINYPILAFATTILINRKEINIGERNVLIMTSLEGLFFIIKHTFELINNTR